MSEFRLLAEDQGRRYYLRDGTVTAVALEMYGHEVVIPASSTLEARKELQEWLVTELRDEVVTLGYEIHEPKERISTRYTGAPVVRYALGPDGLTAERELVVFMTVSIPVWPRPVATT